MAIRAPDGANNMFIMLLIDVYGGKLSNLLHSERRGNSIMRTSVEFIEQGKRGASLPRSMKLIFSITSFIFKLYMKRSLLTLFDSGGGAYLPSLSLIQKTFCTTRS